jgi:hypothetical protein
MRLNQPIEALHVIGYLKRTNYSRFLPKASKVPKALVRNPNLSAAEQAQQLRGLENPDFSTLPAHFVFWHFDEFVSNFTNIA